MRRLPLFGLLSLVVFAVATSGCRCMKFCTGRETAVERASARPPRDGTPPPTAREGVVEIQRVAGNTMTLVGYAIFDPDYSGRIWWVLRNDEMLPPSSPPGAGSGASPDYLKWTEISPASPPEMKGNARLPDAELAQHLCATLGAHLGVGVAKVVDSDVFPYLTLACP